MNLDMNILILDDQAHPDDYREPMKTALLPRHHLTVALDRYEAEKIYDFSYDLLLLDHDMEGRFENSDYPNTGYQFCKWLVENVTEHKPQVVLHSHNPVGRKNMRLLLEEHGFHVVGELPYGTDYIKWLEAI